MRLASLAATVALVTAVPALATVTLPGSPATGPARATLPAPQASAMPDIFVDIVPPPETASLPDIVVDRAPAPGANIASAVPDAATWALMLTGLLAVGAILRRRKPVVLA